MTPSILINAPLHVAPRLEVRIESRWRYWQPWAVRHARKQYPTLALDDILPKLKAQHRERVVACLSQKLSWTSITKNKLDDPTATSDAYRLALKLAKERRLAHTI